MEAKVRLHTGDEHVHAHRKLSVLQEQWVHHVLLDDAVLCEVSFLEGSLFGVEDFDVPTPGAEGSLLRVDLADLVYEDDATAHGLAIGLVDPFLVRIGLRMPLPLLQVVRQDEGQWVPRRGEVDRDVPLDAPLTDQLKHTDLGEHGGTIDLVHKAAVLERGRVVDHPPASRPDKDGRHLHAGADGLDTTVLQLLLPGDGHAHVVRSLGQLLLASYIVVDGANPIHVAENGLQHIDDGLRILWRNIILALHFRLHEASAVDVASEVSLGPAPERLWGHIAREPGVLLHCTPGPRVVVGQLLGAHGQPS
mmetsp:Transcript_114127/g.243389  ORF Transcript_114127/g.243389 Transcript_114127/m.243389 type:complete len:307 (-) Transcript_114127:201-1121(-)